MSYHVRRIRRESPKSKPRRIKTLQKPNGVISPRVQKVGGEHFAIVCVDPAKHRSAWMMADYFGNVLIEPQVLQHGGAAFKLAVEQIHQVQQKHDIQDLIVVVERTGNYYLPAKRAFAGAGFETRIVNPFATKQYRMPANPGNKTDETDLFAQHRAAVAGFGLEAAKKPVVYKVMMLRDRFTQDVKADDGCGEAGPGVD
jgi:transposase